MSGAACAQTAAEAARWARILVESGWADEDPVFMAAFTASPRDDSRR